MRDWFKSKFENKKTAFLVVGIWNSLFGVGNFLVLYFISADNLHYSLILSVSYFVSTIQAHFMQRKMVWKSFDPYFPELLRFWMASIVQYLLNLVLLVALVEKFDFEPRLSQVTVTLILLIFSYYSAKKLVFRSPN